LLPRLRGTGRGTNEDKTLSLTSRTGPLHRPQFDRFPREDQRQCDFVHPRGTPPLRVPAGAALQSSPCGPRWCFAPHCLRRCLAQAGWLTPKNSCPAKPTKVFRRPRVSKLATCREACERPRRSSLLRPRPCRQAFANSVAPSGFGLGHLLVSFLAWSHESKANRPPSVQMIRAIPFLAFFASGGIVWLWRSGEAERYFWSRPRRPPSRSQSTPPWASGRHRSKLIELGARGQGTGATLELSRRIILPAALPLDHSRPVRECGLCHGAGSRFACGPLKPSGAQQFRHRVARIGCTRIIPFAIPDVRRATIVHLTPSPRSASRPIAIARFPWKRRLLAWQPKRTEPHDEDAHNVSAPRPLTAGVPLPRPCWVTNLSAPRA